MPLRHSLARLYLRYAAYCYYASLMPLYFSFSMLMPPMLITLFIDDTPLMPPML